MFPFAVLSLDPVIGAIAAGNTVVLKPSEVSPATSSLLAKYIGEYMDSSAVKVVEGAIPETSVLLEQKWDKILYTGFLKFLLIFTLYNMALDKLLIVKIIRRQYIHNAINACI